MPECIYIVQTIFTKKLCTGSTEEVIPHYLDNGPQTGGHRIWREDEKVNLDSRIKVDAARIVSPSGETAENIDIRRPFQIEVQYRILEETPPFRIGLMFSTQDGTVAFTAANSTDTAYDSKSYFPGSYKTSCIVPGDLLNEGLYHVRVSADIPLQKTLFIQENALSFSVHQNNGVNGRFNEKWLGVFCPRLEWETNRVDSAKFVR